MFTSGDRQLMDRNSHPWIPEHRDTNWIERHQQLVNTTLQHLKDEKIVFIGDSLTEGWQWEHKSQNIWDKHYTPRHAYNYGISADRTEHLLWRIENKEFDGLNPKVVVLMIGILINGLKIVLKHFFCLKGQIICG